MGLFDKVKKTTIESRRYEEKLYEVALEEVEAGEVRKGLYAKALSKADGDKEKADGISLEEELLDNKLAYEYSGGKKLSWCRYER